MNVIQNAMSAFGNTLFIDADQIILREINEQISNGVGFCA